MQPFYSDSVWFILTLHQYELLTFNLNACVYYEVTQTYDFFFCSQKHQCFPMILLWNAALFDCTVRSECTPDWLILSCNMCVCSDETQWAQRRRDEFNEETAYRLSTSAPRLIRCANTNSFWIYLPMELSPVKAIWMVSRSRGVIETEPLSRTVTLLQCLLYLSHKMWI